MPTATILDGERLLNINQACARFPGHRGGPQLHNSTVNRWITVGVESTTGEVVRLEAVRAGKRWLTSVEAITRFCERLAGVASPVCVGAPGVLPIGADEAARVLEQLGA